MKKTVLNQFLCLGAVIGLCAGLFFWLSSATREQNSVNRSRSESSKKWTFEVGVRDSHEPNKTTTSGDRGEGSSSPGPQESSGSGTVATEKPGAVPTASALEGRNSRLAYAVVTVGSAPPDAEQKLATAGRIRVRGSDTMVQLMTGWAEAYYQAQRYAIDVNGGGTGSGVSALLYGHCDILAASRELKPEERAKLKEITGKDANEFVVAYDALAVYTNPKNPIKETSIEELREIWADGGSISSWDQVNPGMKGAILLFGRQNNSGTYDYFREKICGKASGNKQREFRSGISELNGSSEVIENIANTPLGLGYSGMGYKTDKVNWLRLSNKKGESGVEPGAEAARSGTYPLSRKLYLYTAGEPTGEVKSFIDWILSASGQKIVAKEGFVPLK